MGKYINIQMNREIHAIVKEHCKTSKQSISGCIEKLVIENLIPKKVLHVEPVRNVLKISQNK